MLLAEPKLFDGLWIGLEDGFPIPDDLDLLFASHTLINISSVARTCFWRREEGEERTNVVSREDNLGLDKLKLGTHDGRMTDGLDIDLEF